MKISPKPCKKKLFGHAGVQKSQTSIWRRIVITALCLSFIAANTAVTLAAGLSVNESHFVSEETDDILYDEDTVYTLYLTHVFRFTSDGQGRNVQAAEKLELTEADFENGVCDLRRFIHEVLFH